MRQKTSHTGDPGTSDRLGLAAEILKAATGPLTGMEMQLESQRRGRYLANPGTCVYEIGAAPGWHVSEGLDYGQKQGPAVRFPDGKYRYWIVSWPGGRQSWTVTRDFQIVPVDQGNRVSVPLDNHAITDGSIQNSGAAKTAQGLVTPEAAQPRILSFGLSPPPGPRRCRACGKEIGPAGPPFCNEDCKSVFFGLVKKG